MLPIEDIIVAETSEDFHALLGESAMIAIFLTASDSNRYAIKDERLRWMMDEEIARTLGPLVKEAHTHINYDWWRDHTRGLELDTVAFRQDLFDCLRGLLTSEFDEWRIQVVVYDDLMEGATLLGSVLIWKDKLIIDKSLYDWMNEGSFDFSFSGRPHYFSLKRDDLESPRYNLMNERE